MSPLTNAIKSTNVRWHVFFTLFALCTVNYVDRAVLSICMPDIQSDLSLDPAIVGLVLSAFFWGYAAMQIPVGWLLDKFHADKLIICSGILWGIFQIITGAFAASAKMFMALRVMLGISEAPIYPGGTKMQSIWLTSKERGRGSALMDTGAALGNAIGGPIVILFMGWFGGWRGALIGAGIFTLCIVLGGSRFLKGTPDTNPYINETERNYLKNELEKEYHSEAIKEGKVEKVSWTKYLTSRNFWCMIIGFFALDSYWFGLMTWGPNYLAQAQGLDIKAIGGAVLMIFGVGVVVELIGGVVTDKWRASGASLNKVLKTIMCTMAAGMAISMYFLSRADSITSALVWLTLGVSFERWCGMLFFVIPPTISQKNHVGTVAGSMNFAGNMGGVLIPIIIGFIVSMTGSYFVALMMFVGFGVAIIITTLLLDFDNKVGSDIQAQSVAGVTAKQTE
ncbi:MFS transporter [Megasphaera paucivorans]|uniref:MFS transporter, ACS family, D-galactonate transporter n=1 Tax=Megasphaera paucivorans TaxID=349095 RepID=A0A1G9WVB0_9FIRM|nr:MFS transporter [Megasphaera paucivorans]SDM88400.1 MFS transporter, ACS family, D-galactonate transporter [Megasphaera paucivorans]